MQRGDRIGGYELEQKLGAGGMGEVWRAMQVELERPVAVKCMHPEGLEHGEGLARFRREMKLHASLLHPNLVTVFDGGIHEGAPFLVMELVTGGSMRELIRGKTPLDPSRVLSLVTGIAAATALLHEKGVVHRDLKPANVLLDAKGVPKVTDFGLSRGTNMTMLTQANHAMGTPAYLPPEVLLGEPATPAADVYAIGILAWESFARRVPFQSISIPELAKEIASGKREPLADAVRGLDPAIYQLVEDCLQRDPKKRPPAAEIEERARRLTEVTKGRRTGKMPRVTSSMQLSSPAVPIAAGPRRLLIATGALFVLGLGLAGFSMREDGPLAVPSSPATPDADPAGGSAASVAPTPASTTPLRDALLAKYRERLATFHPVIHIAPPGKVRGSLDRMIRLIAAPAPEEALAGVFLHIPPATPGPATLRVTGGPAPGGVMVNGQAVSLDTSGAWAIPPPILRAGLNAIVLVGTGKEARLELTPPGPPDPEALWEGCPGLPEDVKAAMPDWDRWDAVTDHTVKLRRGLDQLRKHPDSPGLRMWIADKRLTLARTRAHFKGEDGEMIVGAAVGKQAGGDIRESSEELIALAIQDLESVLASYPRVGFAWILLANLMSMAGFESEAFHATRHAAILEREMVSIAWQTPYTIVDEQMVRGKARRERMLEAVEALRVAVELYGKEDQRKQIEWLTQNLPPATRR